MALATQCPHCGTMFRVAADQLKLRGGIVRCGACTQVFDGSAALVDMAAAAPSSALPSARRRLAAEPASAAAAVPEPAPATAPAPAPAPQEAPAVAAGAEENAADPIYTLAFDRTFAPFGILPQVSREDGQDLAAPQEPEETGALVADARPQPAVTAAPPQAEAQPEAEPGPEPEPEPEPEPALAPAPEAVSAPETEPAAEPGVDEALVAAPVTDHEDEPGEAPAVPTAVADSAPARATSSAPPLLLRESGPATVTMPLPPSAPPVAPRTPRAKAAEARAARRSKLTPTRIEAPKLRVPEPDEPEFVRRGRQRERSGKAVRIAMAAGSLVLLLLLAAQLVRSFGSTLAARHPDMRPALVSACATLGCRIELPAQIDELVIDTGELTTLGGNAYTFSTQLRNQGNAVQSWPSIELTLVDADDKPLVRRVFGPRDYLPTGPQLAAGFAARTEQAVKLHFRVEEPAPSGYHIAVFYP
ncbi:zinc-ribbon domain-containing protein [Massilia sp. UMI-21]|nr:zinc-ribbon domain-containing protein [Massilia sp. UMI-21]